MANKDYQYLMSVTVFRYTGRTSLSLSLGQDQCNRRWPTSALAADMYIEFVSSNL